MIMSQIIDSIGEPEAQARQILAGFSDAQRLRMERVAADAILLFRENGVGGGVNLTFCECDAVFLFLDVSSIPKSQLFVKKIVRRFAKKHSLYFCLEIPVTCMACSKSLESPVRQKIEIGASKIEKNVIERTPSAIAKA
jgi:hypothetical protein